MISDSRMGEASSVESLGGESREGFESAGLQNRLERYGSARENAYRYVSYLKQQQQQANIGPAFRDHLGKLARKLNGCGNYAVFHEYFTIGETRLAAFCTCKIHLLCPLCAIRRAAKATRVYSEKVASIMKTNPMLRLYMVTFTVKNGDDLLERHSHLANSLRKYHKLRHLGRGHQVNKATSAVWSYELTNKDKGWHPHAHAIWLCQEEPDMHRLRDEWREITGDSFIVDVRPVDETDPISGFLEVFKYALKFSDLDDGQRLHAYMKLSGKRLQDSFGELRGLKIEPEDSDQLLDDFPYIKRIYEFFPTVGYVPTAVYGSVDDPINPVESKTTPENDANTLSSRSRRDAGRPARPDQLNRS